MEFLNIKLLGSILVASVLLGSSSIYAKSKCNGIVTKDYSKSEETLPFKRPDVPDNYSGHLSYLQVVSKRGKPVRNYNADTVRARVVGYSKAQCVPNETEYPDVHLIIEEYKDSKLSSRYLFNHGAKILSEQQTFHANGKLASDVPIINEVYEGEATFYHDNGRLHFKANYKNNKLNSCIDSKYPYGKPHIHTCFSDGALVGDYKELHKNGTVKVEGHYKGGSLHGLYREYFESGKPKIETTYANGLLNGSYSEKHPNDTTKYQATFSKGKLKGSGKGFYEDGTPSAVYLSGTKAKPGYFRTYYEDKTVSSSVPIINDKYQGAHKEFYPSGKVKAKCQYVNDVQHGTCYTYYENGIATKKVIYQKGKIAGLTSYYLHGGVQHHAVFKGTSPASLRQYNAFGALEYVYPFKNGKIDGDVKRLYRNGAASMRVAYKDGKPTGSVLGFFPNGKQQYKAVLSNEGEVLLGGAYFKSGLIQYFLQKKDGKLTEHEFYADGSTKMERVVNQDGSAAVQQYYVGKKNPYYQEKLDSTGKLASASVYLNDEYLSCLWVTKQKAHLCGMFDYQNQVKNMVGTSKGFEFIKSVKERGSGMSAPFIELVSMESSSNLVLKNDKDIIVNAVPKNAQGQHCYDLGFMKHCE